VGAGADQTFAPDVVAPVATPLPAALLLFASGLGGLGLLGWRRSGRRKPSPEQAQDKGRNGTAAVRRPFYLMRCTLVEVGSPRKILQRKRMSAVRVLRK
jgi:hypothetical protein